MNNKTRKITAAGLILALTAGMLVPLQTFAGEKKAAGTKEEVIYANLLADGSLSEIYAVNIYTPEDDGTVTDYGDYSSLKNLTSEDEIKYENGKIEIKTEEDTLYCEGILEDISLPWNFDITYRLDGDRCDPSGLAGKSGHLEIEISITENPERSQFFENFALQPTLTLDSVKCTGIRAEGASIANVGSDKQITWTILPGQEKDLVLTADVTDFEMDEMQFNALPLELDIDFDLSENEEFQDALDELTESTQALSDGAGDLSDGISKAGKAAASLNTGAQTACAGAAAAADAAGQLSSGLTRLSQQSEMLNQAVYQLFSQMVNQVQSQLQSAGLPVSITTENYSEVLGSLMESPQLQEAQRQQIAAVKQQLDSCSQLYQAVAAYTGGVDSAAEGAGRLSSSLDTLEEGMETLSGGMKALDKGFDGLRKGAEKLNDGTGELNEKAGSAGDDIEAELSDAVDDMTGGSWTPVSYISSENSDVTSVQFIIKTETIEKPEAEITDEETEERSFWEKILDLFR